MDLAATGAGAGAGALLARWWWVIALVLAFAAVYRFGAGKSAASPAGYGCLVAVVITTVFLAVVVF